MEESLQKCEELIMNRNAQHVVINASKIVLAESSKPLRKIINECALINVDGMSIVWAARLMRIPVPQRVTGIDLMYRLLESARDKNYRVYLLGAREDVMEKVASNFKKSGIRIVGQRNGYWSESEEDSIVANIARTRPDLLLVAMPSPQKELFLSRNMGNLNVGLAFGVGGSFDVEAGVTQRAPLVLQKMGLEWFFRLVQEPRKMFKRYLVGNLKFSCLYLKWVLGFRW